VGEESPYKPDLGLLPNYKTVTYPNALVYEFIPSDLMVGVYELVYELPEDLQSASIGRSGNPPG